MSEFVGRWAPRIGDKAARMQVWTSRFAALGTLGSAWILLLGLGFATHDGILRDVAVALMAVDLCFIAMGVIWAHRSRRAMSQHLGIKVES